MIGHCSKVDCELSETIPIEKRPVMHHLSALKVDIYSILQGSCSKQRNLFLFLPLSRNLLPFRSKVIILTICRLAKQ